MAHEVNQTSSTPSVELNGQPAMLPPETSRDDKLKKWNLEMVISHTFYFFCVICFTIHFIVLSVGYFSYPITTRVSYSLPETFDTPHLALCFSYAEVLDVDRFKRDKGVKVPRPTHRQDLRRFQQYFTLFDIGWYTPLPEDLIVRCLFRTNYTYQTVIRPGTQCLASFHVSKFYSQEYICYHVNYTEGRGMRYSQLAGQLTTGGMIYQLFINRTITPNVDIVRPILFDAKEEFPFTSRYLASSVKRLVNGRVDDHNNHISVSFRSTTIQRLGAPYQEGCLASPPMSHDRCLKTCLIDRITRQLERVPFSTILDAPYKTRHINEEEFLNIPKMTALHKIEGECRDQCNYLDCEEILTETQIIVEPQEDDYTGQEFSVSVFIPRQLHRHIVYENKIGFADYLLSVMSCVVVWWGISMMSLHDRVTLEKVLKLWDVVLRIFQETRADYQRRRSSRIAFRRNRVRQTSPTASNHQSSSNQNSSNHNSHSHPNKHQSGRRGT